MCEWGNTIYNGSQDVAGSLKHDTEFFVETVKFKAYIFLLPMSELCFREISFLRDAENNLI